MLFFGLPQARRSVAALAAAAFVVAVAQAEAAEVDDDAPLLGEIQQILSRDGPYSIDLLEPLTSLGVLYRESDDLSFALASFEQAVQILRVNRGLHTLDQVPLVRQIIRLEEERGNVEGAWDRQQDLLELLRRHPHDLRIVPVLRELADEEMQVLAQFIAHEKPPQVILGCFYQEWPAPEADDCRAGSRRTVVQGMLAEAQRNYADAIGVLLHHKLYGSEELRELELDLLRGVDLLRSLYGGRSYPPPMVPRFMGAASIEPWRSRIAPIAALSGWKARQVDTPIPIAGGNAAAQHVRMMSPYHRGRESLRRLYQYDAVSNRPLVSQVDSLVQLADWDLLYSRNGRAVDAYAAAYALLAGGGASASSIEALFTPATPVVLPAFQPSPLANDDTRPAAGYVDVAFEITRYGRARAIEVRDVMNASDEALDRLVGIIKGNRFRPRVMNGEFPDAAPVLLRYYVYD
jgi:hypothetical protein